MNIVGAFACLLVAIACFEKGFGIVSQTLFDKSTLWLWHICGLYWLGYAVAFAHRIFRPRNVHHSATES